MLCGRPPKLGGNKLGSCGVCEACLQNKRMDLVNRLQLECACYPESVLLLLTIDGEHYPSSRQALSEMMYRCFKHADFRVFAVSERGEKSTRRVHVHAVSFGQYWHGSGDYWRARWPYGLVFNSDRPVERPGYVAKYLYQGSADKDVLEFHPDGLGPPVVYWPRRPALGVPIVPHLVSKWLASEADREYMRVHQDVPNSMRLDGKRIRLPRQLVVAARKLVGFPSSSSYRDMLNGIRDDDASGDAVYSAQREAKRKGGFARVRVLADRERSRQLYVDPGLAVARERLAAAVEAGKYIPRRLRKRKKRVSARVDRCSNGVEAERQSR